ncbi:denn domain-containing protein, partial [Lynx pardinus]
FISLTRPLDSHLEHVDFRSLLRCLRFEQILQIFASAVLERRIIFLAEDLRSDFALSLLEKQLLQFPCFCLQT